MNNCNDGINIESAILRANYPGVELFIMYDDFEILDLLKSIKRFDSFSPLAKCGLDAIRELDNIPSSTTAYLLFRQKNVYFILIKFSNHNDDGGLVLFYSINRGALIHIMKKSVSILSNTDKIINWLNNSSK